MPLTPTSKGTVPPGGYCRYRDPDDGWEFAHPYYDHVKNEAFRHRTSSNLEIPTDWDFFFDQAYCKSTPQACVEIQTIPESSPLSKTQLAINFARSMGQWAMSGFKIASAEVLKERHAQCEGDIEGGIPRCPHFASWNGFSIARCGKCGCSMLKTYIATEKCPIGKWGPV